ncbi:nucleoside hydrolase [Atribacter laminatus]|uniref:Pyrimidine-specific ribonucleoside hydrolase RihA n=1 Tax=Atribacter laminatus TaxID=2847778 RepID=A0A7T1AMD5_ATRLM|nr:nucleoside hydrolase [Atribacter laminatus]QPM68579.1 Pyrimidine-specific ribonucleoside hydrolase RihA [Atribacter laminatus]
MPKIILDTDIGSDVDDAMALLFALHSPELDIKGVTTVYGDVRLRAEIALKLIDLDGKKGIPVAVGSEFSLLRERNIWRDGIEGKGIITGEETDLIPINESAADFIIRMVHENPGEIVLVAVGPLTNLAVALINDPTIIPKIKEIIFIGGMARVGDNSLDVPAIEYNVRCDPEAARLVFRSGIPIVMLGMDVTRRNATFIDSKDLKKIKEVGAPVHLMAVTLLEIYWDYLQKDGSWMHDALALAFTIDRSLVKTRKLFVEIETKGICTTGLTLVTDQKDRSNVEVGVSLDEKRFLPFFLERICRQT